MWFNKKKKSGEYTPTQMQKIKDYEYLNTLAMEGKSVLIGDTAASLFPCEELFPFRVYNRSIAEDTADKLLSRLERNCVNIAPRTVILMIGATDIINGRNPSDILENIRAIVARLVDTNEKRYIYVCSIPPLTSRGNYSAAIGSVNTALSTSWSDQKYIRYFDAYDALTDESGVAKSIFFASDGIPNIHGFAVIAKKLLEAMNYNPNQNNQHRNKQ